MLAALGAAALVALAACGNDKDIDPPAELVDIVAKRDVRAPVERRAWAATPSSCGSRCGRSSSTDVVYAASHDGEVVALAARYGPSAVWSVKTKLPLSAGPEVGGGLVVLGSSDGDIIALDASERRRALAQIRSAAKCWRDRSSPTTSS